MEPIDSRINPDLFTICTIVPGTDFAQAQAISAELVESLIAPASEEAHRMEAEMVVEGALRFGPTEDGLHILRMVLPRKLLRDELPAGTGVYGAFIGVTQRWAKGMPRLKEIVEQSALVWAEGLEGILVGVEQSVNKGAFGNVVALVGTAAAIKAIDYKVTHLT